MFEDFTTDVELSINSNFLLRENKLNIPPQDQTLVLVELHVSHPGIEHMKRLTRNCAWWPGLHRDIEQK